MCQLMLRSDQGAAFSVEPESGQLAAFGEQRITVTGYSDMWGRYTDTIIAEVDSMPEVLIPVTVHAIGCPLSFQISSSNQSAPCLRFGTHVSGVKPISRPVKINNSSPFDIRLDWETYNVVEEDKKLVDLLVTYGRSFPLRDDQGREIVPSDPEDSPQRPATMYDSPYTTPRYSAFSRAQTKMTKETGPPVYPKVISLKLRPHEGVRSDDPYTVSKSQIIIPAKRHNTVDLLFTPPQIDSEKDCLSFALGHMSIEQQVRESRGVLRRDGLDVQPLKVEMFSHIKPAKLTIEYDDDDDSGGILFTSSLGDLLDDGMVCSESLRSSHVLLHNLTAARLTFSLRTSSPFLLLNPAPPGGVHGNQEVSDISLNPKQTLAVDVGLCVSLDMLTVLDSATEGEEVENVKWTRSESGERRLHYQSQFDIAFNNGTKQMIPLKARVSLPSFTLSTELVDFGTCFVNQERAIEFTISNRTQSNAVWRLELETAPENEDDVFAMSQSSGLLEAYVTHLSKSKTIIRAAFTARTNKSYETVYLLKGELGEEERRLVVRGAGSYDGKHESVVA